MSRDILVLNSGSSSVKFTILGTDGEIKLEGAVSEIGTQAQIKIADDKREVSAPDHIQALNAIFDALAARGFEPKKFLAAGHRVVHGGEVLHAPTRIDENIKSQIRDLSALAPLHNPHNLAGIEAVEALAPELSQFACFDTAFHQTIPKTQQSYALPDIPATKDMRRYGFHGISYQGLVHDFEAIAALPLPQKLLALHLGNGASLCAIKNGQSVATTMGYSPLEGLIMGTRTGHIDGNAVLDLAEREGVEGARNILNRQSGLLALAGTSNMQEIEARTDADARIALDAFIVRVVGSAGSMIAAMGGVDAVVFTGGIGENSALVRGRVIEALGFLGLEMDASKNTANSARIEGAQSLPIAIIPAREEATIAREGLKII